MEIALSSYIPRTDRSAPADTVRRRQSASAQASAQQNPATNRQAAQRASSAQQTETVRVINGEVLSSRTERVAPEPAQELIRPSANQQPSGQPDRRRITAEQAIQNFRENEEMVADTNQQRQVSGIIDVYA